MLYFIISVFVPSHKMLSLIGLPINGITQKICCCVYEIERLNTVNFMKKTIALLIALTMVLCLALTGCGQNADRPGDDFDTGDSGIMEGTNNSDGAENENNGNDESVPDGGAIESEPGDEGSTNQNPNGSYTWQVGNYTLTTKINVMDYIDGDIFRANEMAAALGWDPIAAKTDGSYQASMSAKRPAYYESNGMLIYYSRAESQCNGIFGFIKGVDRTFTVSARIDIGDYIYRMNDADLYWTIEEIVCFACSLENTSTENTDPFSDLLHYVGGEYQFID